MFRPQGVELDCRSSVHRFDEFMGLRGVGLRAKQSEEWESGVQEGVNRSGTSKLR